MNETILQTQILEILKGHEHRFDAIDERFKAIDERFDAVDKRLDAIEKHFGERLSRLEAIAEQHDIRFVSMETEIRRLVDKVDSSYKWLIGLFLGLMLPMWASLIIAILLKT